MKVVNALILYVAMTGAFILTRRMPENLAIEMETWPGMMLATIICSVLTSQQKYET